MTQAVFPRLESIQIITQLAFQKLTQNQLMTKWIPQVLIQVDSWLKGLSHFWLKSTHDSTEKHLILVDSWFDSESCPCLLACSRTLLHELFFTNSAVDHHGGAARGQRAGLSPALPVSGGRNDLAGNPPVCCNLSQTASSPGLRRYYWQY